MIRPVKALRDKKRIQAWAAKNAYTLTFLSVMFVITWVIYFVTEVFL